MYTELAAGRPRLQQPGYTAVEHAAQTLGRSAAAAAWSSRKDNNAARRFHRTGLNQSKKPVHRTCLESYRHVLNWPPACRILRWSVRSSAPTSCSCHPNPSQSTKLFAFHFPKRRWRKLLALQLGKNLQDLILGPALTLGIMFAFLEKLLNSTWLTCSLNILPFGNSILWKCKCNRDICKTYRLSWRPLPSATFRSASGCQLFDFTPKVKPAPQQFDLSKKLL